MPQEKQKQLKQFLELTNNSLTKKEFEANFRKVLELVRSVIEQNKRARHSLQTQIQTHIEEAKRQISKDSTVEVKQTIQNLEEKANKLFKEQQNTLDFIRDKVRKLQDGRDGKDADEDAIIQSVLNQIPRPEEPQEETGEEIFKKIWPFFEEKFGELKEDMIRKAKTGGGGTSASGVKFALGKLMKTETPTGAIDGVNTTYTVTQDIHHIFSFGINGQMIHSDSYTIKGKTIEFDSAIPASLSGTTFEIIYA